MAIAESASSLPTRRRRPLGRVMAALDDKMPKGLYARALIIIIAPMVLPQSGGIRDVLAVTDVCHVRSHKCYIDITIIRL